MAKSTDSSFNDIIQILSQDLKEPVKHIYHLTKDLYKIEQQNLSSSGQIHLNELQDSVLHLTDMITELTAYSKIGQKEKAFMETNLSSIIKKSIQLLFQELEMDPVEIQIQDDLPWIACDKTLVRELFRQLISNAIKFNNRSKVKIEIGIAPQNISVTNSTGSIERQLFFIRDNGIGIRKKHFDNVFKIFKRLHPASKYGGGLGTGLAISRKIVEYHGGRIWIDSIHGKETTVYFSLK